DIVTFIMIQALRSISKNRISENTLAQIGKMLLCPCSKKSRSLANQAVRMGISYSLLQDHATHQHARRHDVR
ncbi:hypothetical protein, partial [Brucella thiophenivorans]